MHLDGALVPAKLLVNGHSIAPAARIERIDYFHIELDSHDLVLAEGAASETYLEDRNRAMFHNAGEFAILYGAKRAALFPQFCAPRLASGPALAALRARLAGEETARAA